MKGDFLVKSNNPKALDQTLQQMGAVLIGGPDNFVTHDGAYVVRPLGAPGYVRFAVEQQGYAKIVGDAPDPAPWDAGLAAVDSVPCSVPADAASHAEPQEWPCARCNHPETHHRDGWCFGLEGAGSCGCRKYRHPDTPLPPEHPIPDVEGTEPRLIRERIVQAAITAVYQRRGDHRDYLAAAREALTIARDRLLSNTEGVPPPGMLTPMQVAANQIDGIIRDLTDGNQAATQSSGEWVTRVTSGGDEDSPLVIGSRPHALEPLDKNPCPKCGTWLWRDPRPCWYCARQALFGGGTQPPQAPADAPRRSKHT